MKELRLRRGGIAVSAAVLVLAATLLLTFICVERADARCESETEVWVEVGCAAACGASSGNVEAVYKGRTVQVSYAHDNLRVYDGRKTRVAPAKASRCFVLTPMTEDRTGWRAGRC